LSKTNQLFSTSPSNKLQRVYSNQLSPIAVVHSGVI